MKIPNLSASLYFFLVVVLLFASSCLGDRDTTNPVLAQFELELDLIDKYLDESDIDAEVDSLSQIRYVIHDLGGTGENPVDTDTINVDYAGRFLSTDEEFDSGEGSEFRLSRLISAWRIMLPQIQEGDSITIYTPSYYAYGPDGYNSIPGNATLIFEMKLNFIK